MLIPGQCTPCSPAKATLERLSGGETRFWVRFGSSFSTFRCQKALLHPVWRSPVAEPVAAPVAEPVAARDNNSARPMPNRRPSAQR